MKKFTLMVAAALVSLGAAAQTVQSLVPAELKASFQHQVEMKNVGLSPYNMKTLAVDPAQKDHDAALLNEMRANANHKNLQMPSPAALMKQGGVFKADAVDQYGFFTAQRFSKIMMGTAPVYLNGAFYTVSDSEIQLDPYGLDYFKGEIVKGSNYFSAYGADSITFQTGQVIGRDDAGNQYAVYACAPSGNSQEGYVLKRSSAATFGGYYFPESNQILIYDYFAIFPVNGTDYLDGSAFGFVNLLDQQDILNSALLTKVTAASYYDNEVVELDSCVTVFLDQNFMCISGLSYQLRESAFLGVDLNEDFSLASVENWQFVGAYNMPQEAYGGGYLEWYEVAIDEAGNIASFDFFVDETESGGLLLTNDGLASLMDFGVSIENEELTGNWGRYKDMEIEITPVTLIEAGIDGVTENKGDVVATEYFDMLGRKADKSHGLVVKKMRYADGSVKSVKVVK